MNGEMRESELRARERLQEVVNKVTREMCMGLRVLRISGDFSLFEGLSRCFKGFRVFFISSTLPVHNPPS